MACNSYGVVRIVVAWIAPLWHLISEVSSHWPLNGCSLNTNVMDSHILDHHVQLQISPFRHDNLSANAAERVGLHLLCECCKPMVNPFTPSSWSSACSELSYNVWACTSGTSDTKCGIRLICLPTCRVQLVSEEAACLWASCRGPFCLE